mgnify:CR=1 FL=1
MYQPPNLTAGFLIRRNAIAQNFIVSHGILTLSAAVTGIALDGVDNAVFAFLHDADMVGQPILRAGRASIIPVEENDLTGRRLKAAVLPLPTVFEPLHAVDTACKFRYHAAVDISTLIGAPGNKAGAPFDTASEGTFLKIFSGR